MSIILVGMRHAISSSLRKSNRFLKLHEIRRRWDWPGLAGVDRVYRA
jgi:hypothetical protein